MEFKDKVFVFILWLKECTAWIFTQILQMFEKEKGNNVSFIGNFTN